MSRFWLIFREIVIFAIIIGTIFFWWDLYHARATKNILTAASKESTEHKDAYEIAFVASLDKDHKRLNQEYLQGFNERISTYKVKKGQKRHRNQQMIRIFSFIGFSWSIFI